MAENNLSGVLPSLNTAEGLGFRVFGWVFGFRA